MPDVLIRDVPEGVLAAIGAHTAERGLSRSEYLRRRLEQDVRRTVASAGVTDLHQFGQVFSELADPEFRAQAWS